MNQGSEIINSTYGHKLRVRVCGICIQDDKILLVKHKHLGKTGTLWAPPGGGMQYGESAKEALQREFLEETNLKVNVHDFLFVHEYLDPPLHGIELFFKVDIERGDLEIGIDPELEATDQILTDVKFKSLKKLQMSDYESLHYVLQNSESLETLINQKGYFKFH